ncbi:MAG: hypothetical protein IPJ69_11425 [Deltaproteobacteria bacterium]|nr:MAG: hypothetical protein IPJ69_11425 [Deltaproteobacteria bacterium]
MKSTLIGFSAFFSLAVIVFWIVSVSGRSHVVAFMGAGYGLLCFGFLVAQIIAFVKSHMDYDEVIEQPKYDIILKEAKEWENLSVNITQQVH